MRHCWYRNSSPRSRRRASISPARDVAHGASANAATGKSADEILATFASMYGPSHPSPYWAHAYDATTLLLTAIESVAVKEGGKLHVDRAALREALATTVGFQASPGHSRATRSGDCGSGHVNIYLHQGRGDDRPCAVTGGLPLPALTGHPPRPVGSMVCSVSWNAGSSRSH